MRAFARLLEGIAAAMTVAAIAAIATLAFPLFYDALARKAGHPTIWVFDTSQYVLIAGAFLANAYALKRGNHFRVHILQHLFPRLHRFLDDLALASALLFGAVIAYGGGTLVHYSFTNEIRSASLLDVALFLPQSAVPLGGMALALQALAMLIRREAPSQAAEFE